MAPALAAPRRLRRAVPGAAGAVLFACLVGLGVWLAARPLARSRGPGHRRGPAASGTGMPAAARIVGGLVLTGPAIVGDPAAGTPFAVRVGDANTAAGAILRLQQMGASAPAGTYVPIPSGAAGAYHVLAGAFPDSVEAAALLASLRSHGQLSETSGTVVRLPLAYMIERDVAADSAAVRVAAFVARGLPVYALRQADGRVWLYAGAFAAAADTTPVADALRQAGVSGTLAYRMGRSF